MASGDRRDTARAKGEKPKKLSQKEQSERFKAVARELGADETGDAFERAVARVIKRPDSKPIK